jgi:hypothetical protein
MKTKDLSWFVAALLLGGLAFALVWCSLVVDNFSSYHTFTK